MMLVVGGIAQGKRTYVRSLGYDDAQVGRDPADGRPVLLGLEDLLRTGPLGADALDLLAGKEIVACCEVGLGVVPADAGERAWRELVGRTCAQLAARATRVVRMVCGIPVVIRDVGSPSPAVADEGHVRGTRDGGGSL